MSDSHGNLCNLINRGCIANRLIIAALQLNNNFTFLL